VGHRAIGNGSNLSRAPADAPLGAHKSGLRWSSCIQQWLQTQPITPQRRQPMTSAGLCAAGPAREGRRGGEAGSEVSTHPKS
jgi:hypothetical protein